MRAIDIADMPALMTRKSCEVEMRNAILGNHLKTVFSHLRKSFSESPHKNFVSVVRDNIGLELPPFSQS